MNMLSALFALSSSLPTTADRHIISMNNRSSNVKSKVFFTKPVVVGMCVFVVIAVVLIAVAGIYPYVQKVQGYDEVMSRDDLDGYFIHDFSDIYPKHVRVSSPDLVGYVEIWEYANQRLAEDAFGVLCDECVDEYSGELKDDYDFGYTTSKAYTNIYDWKMVVKRYNNIVYFYLKQGPPADKDHSVDKFMKKVSYMF